MSACRDHVDIADGGVVASSICAYCASAAELDMRLGYAWELYLGPSLIRMSGYVCLDAFGE